MQIDWGVRLVERVVEKDTAGNPIDNSAGAAFDPPVMEDEAILTLRIVQNESTFDAVDAFNYANTTNSAACTIAGLNVSARQAKCLGITGSRRVRSGTTYWAVNYEFEFKPATWARLVLDAGMFYLSAGEPTSFKDDEKAVMQTPQLLNGSGAEGTTAVYLTFYTLTEKNFGALGLGSV